jgi:hypothetical protein
MIAEKKLLEGTVEHGEIVLVSDTAGRALLQVKDVKVGNMKTRKRITASNKESRSAAVVVEDTDKDVEDINSREVMTFLPMDDQDDNSATPTAVSYARPLHTSHVDSKHQAVAQRPLVDYISSAGVTPSSLAVAPKRQVKFGLLPSRSTTSILKPPKRAIDDRRAQIGKLQAELAVLQAGSGDDAGVEEFAGYDVIDVPRPNTLWADDSDIMPEIRLRPTKQEREARYHFERRAGLLQKATPMVPPVSPMSFYQGIAVPPSARSKGKQRAFADPTTERGPADFSSPSSAALHAQVQAYARDRQWYSADGAGPSHGRYM